MPKALVLLSDIHAKEEHFNPISKYFYEMVRILNNDLKSNEEITFIISGDIAFSGKPLEYNFIKDEFDKIKKHLTTDNERKISFLVLPGNHDLDFSLESTVRKMLIEGDHDFNEADEDTIQVLSEPHRPFFEFSKEFESFESSKCFDRKTIEYNSCDITIDMYNSTLLSSLNEKEASLKIVNYSKNKQPFSANSLRIATFHHPFYWYGESDRRKYEEYFIKNYDLIITGHEHNSDLYSEVREGNTTIKYNNGVFFESSSGESSFRLIRVLSEELDYNYSEYVLNLDTQRYSRLFEKEDKGSFDLTSKENRIVLDKSFVDQIEKIPILLKNEKDEYVTINDLYVEQLFERRSDFNINESLKTKSEKIYLKGMLSNLEKSLVFIEGRYKSGKTIVANQIFLEYYSISKYPIIINGNELKKHDENFLVKIIRLRLEEIYENLRYEDFTNKAADDKILIIDDVSSVKNIRSFLDKGIPILEMFFKHIILMVDDSTMDTLKFKSDYNDSYDHYSIRDFNSEQRYELTEKWFEFIHEDKERISEKTLSASNTLDDIFKNKSLVPSPETVTLVLNQIDRIGNESSVAPTKLYDYLLTSYLKEIEINDSKVRIIMILISYISYEVYLTKDAYFDEIELTILEKAIKKHYNDYLIKTNLNDLISTLLSSRIFELVRDGVYRYSNSSFYYYTLSKYIIEHTKNHREYLSSLLDNVWEQHAFNSLIFYSYISIDDFLIEKIVDIANSIEPSVNVVDLGEEINVGSLPSMEANDTLQDTYEETSMRRKATKRSIDELESLDQETEIPDNLAQTDFHIFLRLTDLFEVMIRSYPGQIKGEKFKSAFLAIYKASFRVVTSILSDDELLRLKFEQSIDHYDQREELSKKDRTKIAEEFVGKIYFVVIMVFLIKSSRLLSEQSYVNNVELLEELVPESVNREMIKLFAQVINFNIDKIDHMIKLSNEFESNNKQYLIGFLQALTRVYLNQNFVSKYRRIEISNSALGKNYYTNNIGEIISAINKG